MKIKKCRSCGSKKIVKAFNIGSQNLTGLFLSNKNEKVDSGSLEMVFCNNCKLLQLKNSFNPSEMYGDNYGYMSSINASMMQHLKEKSEKIKKLIKLEPNDIICDIGSNDGSFLSFFSRKFTLLGIDPTIKKLSKFYRKDIIKLPNFFSKDLISKKIKKKIKIVTTISMFYDLENPKHFAKEIYDLLDDNGIWHLEQSYMPMMIKNNSYDTICHEHLEYYSLKSIKYIFDKVGFKIIDVEFNDINGGSFSITVAKRKSQYNEVNQLVQWLIKKENLFGYNKISTFKIFYKNIIKHKKLLRNLLLNLKKNKKKVLGYGASTKGNVILQFCKIDSRLLSNICDVNEFKYEKYTPGSKIKIISEERAKKLKPDYFIVFPWHFRNFILNKEKNFIKSGVKFIFPLPEIDIV